MDQDHDIIRRLVRDVIESGRTVEEVCRKHPRLVEPVRRLWQRTRAVEEQVEALFPSSDAASRPGALAPSDQSLPRIPGYDIQGILGFGGMGVVYKARHESLRRTVAIKAPLAGAFATATERQRHLREAQAVAALGHPNIISVHDVGEFDGQPYFSMEFIDGPHLGAWLANTPQPAREAAAMVATLAEAMQCAHQAGIVHRDLKPANVLLTPDGTPKITDFGLARSAGRDATLTVGGFQFGTPSYIAPEQASGQAAAQTSSVDIYSLGAILYEMLTGRPPFRAESAVETLRQVMEEEPAPPSRLNPRVPRDLETICLKCLHKETRRRYASASELADDLRRYLRGEPIHARPVGTLYRAYRWGRRRPAYAALIGVGMCGVIASVGVGFWVQHVQSVRASEAALREGRARQAIETAVALADDLRANGRWIEARHVLDDAGLYVTEANSEASALMLASADRHLAAAWDLDDIRRRYPESSEVGFDYRPAIEAYRRVFVRLGLGEDVSIQSAAEAVGESPIRKELLIALDNSAFVARAIGDLPRLDRPLAIARTADPDPWRDRFRQPRAWLDRDSLLALHAEASSSAVPPPPHQVVIIGVLLMGLGAHDKAIEILREAHRLDPVDFWVNLELGNALSRAGRSAEASHYFRAAVTIQPKNPGPWITLGALLNRSGFREEATIAALRATELNPHLPLAWRNAISYLRAGGRLEEAEAALKRAIEQNPGQRDSLEGLSVGIRWDYARRFASRGEWRRALDEYRSAQSRKPEDGEFWFEAAAVSLLVGEREGFEQARDIMLNWSARTSLRPFLVARAVTLTPAPIELVRSASAISEPEMRRESQLFWSLTERGAILCRSGRPAEAIPLFERSLAAAPSAGRAISNWLWLAIANHQLGKTEEAVRWHATAVAWLDPFHGVMPENATAIGLHLHNWLEAHVLRREADALLSSGKTGTVGKPE